MSNDTHGACEHYHLTGKLYGLQGPNETIVKIFPIGIMLLGLSFPPMGSAKNDSNTPATEARDLPGKIALIKKGEGLFRDAEKLEREKRFKEAIERYKAYLEFHSKHLAQIDAHILIEKFSSQIWVLNVPWRARLAITRCREESASPRSSLERLEFRRRFGISEGKRAAHLPERYLPTTLLKTPWGSGPAEFGFSTATFREPTDDSTAGPIAMDVSLDGTVYIFDAVNWRVVLYDEAGKHLKDVLLEKEPPDITPSGFKGGYNDDHGIEDGLKIDSKGDIYLETTGDHGYGIARFGAEGKFGQFMIEVGYKERLSRDARYKKYFDLLESEGKLQTFDSVSFHKIFPTQFAKAVKYLGEFYPIQPRINSSMNRVVEYCVFDSYKESSEREWRARSCIGSEDVARGVASKRYKFGIAKITDKRKLDNILLVDTTGDDIREAYPLAEDVQGNTYVMVETEGNDNEGQYRKNWIYKYDLKGNLLAMVDVLPGLRPFIGFNGKAYQLIWNPVGPNSGLELLVWQKQ